jgi:acetyl esterase/lipase
MKILLPIALYIVLVPAAALSQSAHEEIPLWPGGAPGFEARRNEAPIAKDYWISNIHNPSITVYLPPKDKATGAAVVICPGGGHRQLVFNAEGDEPARYLNSIGVAAFVLKYRLAREPGSPYSIEKHARQDGQRAMRLVRSRAKEWGIDTNRIGIMGFSAGGEVVSIVSFGSADGDPSAADPIDRVSCRPDFIIMIYPGPLGAPDVVPSDAPPAFLLAAGDDLGPASTITGLLQRYRAAKVPVEIHIYARGGHGFNMGNRSRLQTLRGWPARLADWLADNYILDPTKRPDEKPQKH